jgi:hypothetical protein
VVALVDPLPPSFDAIQRFWGSVSSYTHPFFGLDKKGEIYILIALNSVVNQSLADRRFN